jgi:hypothetical protein
MMRDTWFLDGLVLTIRVDVLRLSGAVAPPLSVRGLIGLPDTCAQLRERALSERPLSTRLRSKSAHGSSFCISQIGVRNARSR